MKADQIAFCHFRLYANLNRIPKQEGERIVRDDQSKSVSLLNEKMNKSPDSSDSDNLIRKPDRFFH